MVVLVLILLALTALSLSLTAWQWWEARHFHLQVSGPHAFTAAPNVMISAATARMAPVSILKPLKGCDGKTEECLASWFRQSYPGSFEILFGVARPDDPVVPLVRKLIAAHPNVAAHLVICEPVLGPNAKVSSLIHLFRRAQHDVVVISDADVRVPVAFLGQVVPALGDGTGLVNCFYSLVDASNLAMQWEAVATNADFWPQVLQARRLKPMDFALGAAMVIKRAPLVEIGGFENLVDYLADDYELGHRLAATGKTIHLSEVVVECHSEPMGWAEVWPHQLRWARTIRVCRPGPYFLSILNNATVWPLLLLLTAAVAWHNSETGTRALAWIGGFSMACWLVRSISAQDCQRQLLPAGAPVGSWWMPLMKDLLQVLIWGLAFTGDEVVWRGQKFRVLPGGRLMP